MKRVVILMMCLLITPFVSCCTRQTATKQEASSMIKTKQAAQAKPLTVELSENPTTGYTLDWTQEGTGRVTLTSDTYAPTNPPDSGIVGGGGIHSYSFKGVIEGNVTVTFTNSRKWEKDGDKEMTVYHLDVGKDGSITVLQ
jgi:predicted secreted protein